MVKKKITKQKKGRKAVKNSDRIDASLFKGLIILHNFIETHIYYFFRKVFRYSAFKIFFLMFLVSDDFFIAIILAATVLLILSLFLIKKK